MTDYNGLIDNIASELRIYRGKSEPTDAWMSRVVYSVVGRIMLASLWDKDEESVSVIHIKSKAEKELAAFCSLYPDIRRLFPENETELCDEIYEIYKETGFFYHEAYHVEPAPDKVINSNGISLYRGTTIDKDVYMSGLGLYSLREQNQNNSSGSEEIKELFHLPKKNITDTWEQLSSHVNMAQIQTDNFVEYLITNPPFRRGYWKQAPDKDGKISLLRIGGLGEKNYYLYRYESKTQKIMVTPIPNWMTEHNEYREIAVGILNSRGTLPPIECKPDGRTVILHLGYLLPPRALNLLKLYSWPQSMRTMPGAFNRVITREAFNTLKTVLEDCGYSFIGV